MFKTGSIVVCIDKSDSDLLSIFGVSIVDISGFYFNHLTYGKQYKVEDINNYHFLYSPEEYEMKNYVSVTNDKGKIEAYRNKLFVSLKEFRKLKLKKLQNRS